MSVEETNAYIHHRLKVAGADKSIFTDAACEAIYKYSGGTPRLINLLCDTALVYGFAEQNEEINEQLVHDVVREQHSNSIIPTFNTDHSGIASQPAVTIPDSIPLVDDQNTINNQKIAEQSAAYEKAETQSVITESAIKEVDRNKESAELLQRSSQQVAGVVGSAESTTTVSHTGSQPVIEKAKVRNTIKNNSIDESNVTPIKVAQPESQEVTEKLDMAEFEGEPSQHVEPDIKEPEQVMSEESLSINSDDSAQETGRRQDDTEEVAPFLSRRKQDNEDVYPIVHIEDNPKKGFNMVLMGVVTGMFVASIIMMVAAWMMFGSIGNNDQQVQSKNADQQLQVEAESRELNALKKERDAALAVTRALERERDAALTAAKAQEEIRATELRAAEILAVQERRADKKLRQANVRIRAAERSESKALAREREMQLKTERKESELENERLELLRKERKRIEALAASEEKATKSLKEKQSIEERAVVAEPVKVKEKV